MKTKGVERVMKSRIPGSGDLFQPIECSVEMRNMMRKVGINVAMRLTHVKFFR